MNWSAKTGAVLFFSVLAGFEPLAAQTAQSITFDAVGTRILGTSPFAIAAEASSGLAVSFTSTTPAVCSTASVMVTLLAAGTCSITASQPGNGSFSAATPVMRSFAVNAANPSGTMTAAMNSPFGAGSGPQSIAVGLLQRRYRSGPCDGKPRRQHGHGAAGGWLGRIHGGDEQPVQRGTGALLRGGGRL